ncbi:hypothetical protein [Floricoccus tropicus]|uniref:hypothetical protein n=1 Tax=Floricoccus tropicus TaxID=1859473 RepID=UPI0013012836|nr:hypothetical protein [Floricoccus tropicus]
MYSWGLFVVSLALLAFMYQRWLIAFVLFIFGGSILVKARKNGEKYGNKKDN